MLDWFGFGWEQLLTAGPSCLPSCKDRICIVSFITSAASQEKENKTLYVALKKRKQLQMTLDNSKLKLDKAIIRTKHKYCSGNDSFIYWIRNYSGLAQKGPLREYDFWNAFYMGLYGTWFFECSSYQEPTVFVNLQKFWLKFKYNPSKLSLFLIIIHSVNIH